MLSDHRKAEQRSLRYHAAIAERLTNDPAIVVRAKQRVERWLADGSVARHYAEGWQAQLTAPLESLRAFLIDPSETARAFRQVSPFAGALSPRDRWALWAASESDDDATAA
jgi:hypothetical protein